jgi:type IV pilus assembly protein PilY1
MATDSIGEDGLYDYPLWDAELLLQNRIENGGTTRTIFTYIPGTGQVDFTTADKADFASYLDCDLDQDGIEDEDDETTALIEYIRGNDTPTGFSGFRDRGGHYIGDIINSSAIYMSAPRAKYAQQYGDTTYTDFINANSSRTPVVYLGANDGMLHCFNAVTGEELWSYIPFNLLPHLQWLTEPSYCHVYYVDLTCRVWDMNLGTAESPDWRSILVGGMRFGGTPARVDTNDNGPGDMWFRSAVFALDVTNPTKPLVDPLDDTKDRNIIMWEIEDDDFGYTTSMPVTVRVNDTWYVLFGSGPKTDEGDGGESYIWPTRFPPYDSRKARFYVVNPANGNIVRAMHIGDGFLGKGDRNFFGNPVAVDFDSDYNVDLIYVGDAKGNLWRIKTYQESAGTKSYEAPSGWVIDVGGSNPGDTRPKPVLAMCSDWHTLTERKPFFAKPAVTMDDQGRLWAYFGTGRYFCSNDNLFCAWGYNCPNDVIHIDCAETVHGEERSVYTAAGIIDRHWDEGEQKYVLQASTLDLGDLDERIIVSGEVAGDSSLTGYAIVDEAYPNTVVETDIDSSKHGWYFRLLEPKERCLGEFRVYGRVVSFLTFNPSNPSSDPCLYGTKKSNLYGVYYTSGTSATEPIWDLTRNNLVDAEDLVVLEEAGVNVGAGILQIEGGGFAGGSPIIVDNVAYLPLGKTARFRDLSAGDSAVTSWREERQE